MVWSLRSHAHSEVGLIRKNNQDSGYYSPTLVAVADGMGGAAAGDLASTVAVRALRQADGHYEGDEMLEVLAGAIARANDDVADLANWDADLEGMGTTVCGAMFSGSQFGLVHLGDSRGYLLRDGQLRRLTSDHSWVQSLVDEGQLSAEEAFEHPHRSLLMKVLNGQPGHDPDLVVLDARLGDRLLFCTDGLSGLVNDGRILELLSEPDPQTALDALVAAALEAGGTDNITIIVSDVVDEGDALNSAESDETQAPAGPQVIGAAEHTKVPDVPMNSSGLGVNEDTRPILDLSLTSPLSAADPEAGDDAVPTGLIDTEASEEARYAPRPKTRRQWVPGLVIALTVLAVLAGLVFGGRAYLGTQYYIGPADNNVAIYQGVPDRVFGITLSTLVERTATKVTDLPPHYARQVNDRAIRPATLEAARTATAELDRKAQICISKRQRSATPSPVPAEPGTSGEPQASTPPDGMPTAGSTSGDPTPTTPTTSSYATPNYDPEACS